MDKYICYYHNFIPLIWLLLFAGTGESGRSGKNKAAATTSATSAIEVRACFADFLILQYGENPKVHGNRNKQQLMLDPLLVDREKLLEFMQANEGKTAELWNCVNTARPFPHTNDDGGINGDKMLADLMDIFRTEINPIDAIEPSNIVQEKFQNAQCLLELGVIEGKIDPVEFSYYYKPTEESVAAWFQELLMMKQSGEHQQQQSIMIGKEGAANLDKCLHKSKPITIDDKPFSKGQHKSDEYLLPLDSIKHREELVNFYKRVSVPYWLRKEIADINPEQKQCFADLFVLKFKRLAEMSDEREFVVRKKGMGYSSSDDDNESTATLDYDFPYKDAISALSDTEESKKTFLDCLKEASPFPNYLRNPKHVEILVEKFYDSLIDWYHDNDEMAIPLSQQMQQKMHNAQCWLDLGAVEGKIQMQEEDAMERQQRHAINRMPWLAELKLVDQQRPIVVSTEGAAHLRQCLRKAGPFKAKLEKKAGGENLWNAQLLEASERSDLLKVIKQTPFSEWLYKEISYEQNCVADFLVKRWHAQTTMDYLKKEDFSGNPQPLWRKIMWGDNERERGWPAKVHAKDNVNEFRTLKSCLFRKTALLKLDTASKQQFIEMESLFRLMGGGIYTSPMLAQEINTQSECLAKFLAFKSGDGKCLVKKRRGPADVLFDTFHDNRNPLIPYIIRSFDSDEAVQFVLSAKNCHLPSGETGVFREDSKVKKERKAFNQLQKCGIKMTTEGGKAINVPELLKIHTTAQLYLRAIPMEIFPTTKPAFLHGNDKKCSNCKKPYEQNDRIVVLPCQHNFHDHCMQKRMFNIHYVVALDICPTCQRSFMKGIPFDPNEEAVRDGDLVMTDDDGDQ